MDQEITQQETSGEQNNEMPTVVEAKVNHKPANETGAGKIVYALLVAFACVFVFSVFCGRIIFFPIEVKGSSMQPTLNNASADGNTKRDTVYLGSAKNISRGNIIVFDSETGTKETEYYIKRVVGLPGDTISFQIKSINMSGGHNISCTYQILINGEVLEENYIKEEMQFVFGKHEPYENEFYQNFLINGQSLTLGENEYYLLGDNRNVSYDSRYLGAINSSRFLGKVYLHVEYGDTILEALIKKIF